MQKVNNFRILSDANLEGIQLIPGDLFIIQGISFSSNEM